MPAVSTAFYVKTRSLQNSNHRILLPSLFRLRVYPTKERGERGERGLKIEGG